MWNGLGIPFSKGSVTDSLYEDMIAYIQRVEALGAEVETVECLYSDLGYSDRLHKDIAKQFIDRVEALGGTVEARACLENDILQLLQN
jgi:hypothetical protein